MLVSDRGGVAGGGGPGASHGSPGGEDRETRLVDPPPRQACSTRSVTKRLHVHRDT